MNSIYKTILCLPLLLSFSINGNAQNENLRFEHIGMEDGLSNNNVTAILQDNKGYMWFGTLDGLNKYDGYSFTKYQLDPFDSNSLSQNYIYTIFEDKFGSIWVSTFEGLCKFDRATEKFTRYKPSPAAKFSDPNISAINEDNDGMMWLGSASGGLCRFERQTGKFLPEKFNLDDGNSAGKAYVHNTIHCIYKDRSGILWVGDNSALHKLKITPTKEGQPSSVSITHYQNDPANPNSLSGNIVGSVIEDNAGIIWIATNNGLNSFDKTTGRFKRYQHDSKNIHTISSNNLYSWTGSGIKEDKDGNLWICTDNGLNKLNRNRTLFTTYTNNPIDAYTISSNIIYSLEIDKSGILWAGLGDKLNKASLNNKAFGLRRHDPSNVNSLSNNEVTTILEDSSGVIWIGTYGGGLNRWDKKTNRFIHFKHNPSNPKTLRYDAIMAILEDHHGHLWVCNGEILSRFDMQTGEFVHYNSNAANYKEEDQRIIYSIAEDHDGLLWIGTGNGLKSFDEKTGEFKHYYHNPADSTGISDYTAMTVFADSKDNIWVGYGSIATDRLNKKTGRITHYKHDAHNSASISSNIVTSIYEDSKGNLWMGTSAGGLCYFDYQKEKFTTFTNKHGLINNTVYSILQDNNNHLWLGTQNGLSQFDLASKNFTNYDYMDGLQSNVFAAGHRDKGARFKGSDGTLYFGGPSGFNFFNPVELKANTQIAPIVVTQFKLFDKLVKGANESKEIVLDHDQNYFSFEFSSLSFYNPDKNQYAYKLEGVDKDWVYSGSRRYVGYTNIGPGKYVFKVKGTNNDGIWNEKGTYIIIIIKPPWWRTWWAYTIYALLFIAALYAVHRFQRHRLIQKEREKARAKELTQAKEIEKAYHELRTTQAQLIQSEKMASLGELTAGIAHEIQNPLNFVNNFSEVNKELLNEMSDEIEKGNYSDVKAIAKDVIDNQEKINHHGRRADAIVKGMLQHSRATSSQKESTDINALADEYLRLSYHGLRAKDKSFNATLQTNYDASIGKINVVPQDIGRVLLNLYNNAFYAVTQKQKQISEGYQPTASVTTKKLNNRVEIKVSDNGNGIPQKVLDKIFQPFFTTKPTGQGTGLGLSLAYDIIKAHGGEIKVNNKEGEGAEFVIQLSLEEHV